ncbi:MAG: clan AA aspartic protease [Thermoproteus sp.]
MGLTFAEVEINGRRYYALVDTGFNGEVLVSSRVAKELGLAPVGEAERVLADGRKIKVAVAPARLSLFGESAYVWVEVLESPPFDVLVGVIALERLGFAVDPSSGRIIRVGQLIV